MRVALPNNNGEVNQHFGQSRSFAIVDLDGENKVTNVNEISAADLQHMHEGLAGLLKNQNVDVVIVGGIGGGALAALEAAGLKVLFGASGPVKDVAEAFARGEFVSTRTVCNHHGEHHHHEGGCSHS